MTRRSYQVLTYRINAQITFHGISPMANLHRQHIIPIYQHDIGFDQNTYA